MRETARHEAQGSIDELRENILLFVQIADAIVRSGMNPEVRNRQDALALFTPMYKKLFGKAEVDLADPRWQSWTHGLDTLSEQDAAKSLASHIPAPGPLRRFTARLKERHEMADLVAKDFGPIHAEIEDHVLSLHIGLNDTFQSSIRMLPLIRESMRSMLQWTREKYPDVTVVYARSWLLSLDENILNKLLPAGGTDKPIRQENFIQRMELWGQFFDARGVRKKAARQAISAAETGGARGLIDKLPYLIRAKSWNIDDFYAKYQIDLAGHAHVD